MSSWSFRMSVVFRVEQVGRFAGQLNPGGWWSRTGRETVSGEGAAERVATSGSTNRWAWLSNQQKSASELVRRGWQGHFRWDMQDLQMWSGR